MLLMDCDADTDDDLILDGTEIGLASPQGNDTDPAVFVADLDPATTTDPLDDDSDNDGELDGEEDANQNGRVDAGETDPLSVPGDPTINNLALSSTSGNNLPTDDLTCGYDLAGGATRPPRPGTRTLLLSWICTCRWKAARAMLCWMFPATAWE